MNYFLIVAKPTKELVPLSIIKDLFDGFSGSTNISKVLDESTVYIRISSKESLKKVELDNNDTVYLAAKVDANYYKVIDKDDFELATQIYAELKLNKCRIHPKILFI